MHPILELIRNELDQISATIPKVMPNNEPINIAHNNWGFAGITRDELIQVATSLSQFIKSRGEEELESGEASLKDYVRRLTFIRSNTIPQFWNANANIAVPAYLVTLNNLKIALDDAFGNDNAQAIEGKKTEAIKTLKRVLKPLRAIEAQISDINSRAGSLDEKVERIEQAHEAAEQLPTDLETLKESRAVIATLLTDSTADRALAQKILSEIQSMREKLAKSEKEAEVIIERCNESYRATTSEGLASAFADRSGKLNMSMWIWVIGLIISLVSGTIVGSNQLRNLANAIIVSSTTPSVGNASIWINLLLALLSVGAPVWFAWISTKQIGQRFRLAEDYGYKASISKAYEGYRREAALLDPAFQARLFSSALTRLDEIPLRLVETDTHGSPWHEFASSNVVRQAIETVPDFMGKVTELAKQLVTQSSQTKNITTGKQASTKSTESEDA